MKHIVLRDLDVSRIGLGAMDMSHGYTGAGTDAVRLSKEQLARLSSLPPAAGDTHLEAQMRMMERGRQPVSHPARARKGPPKTHDQRPELSPVTVAAPAAPAAKPN
ncbi:hypothetical protein [Streptomyces sp. NPDC046862]|uniref:hypothetical protein n=1 Tax=Streptomyces sp. NPDC046862 TaxID=3154603 RepID=UPI00345686E8